MANLKIFICISLIFSIFTADQALADGLKGPVTVAAVKAEEGRLRKLNKPVNFECKGNKQDDLCYMTHESAYNYCASMGWRLQPAHHSIRTVEKKTYNNGNGINPLFKNIGRHLATNENLNEALAVNCDDGK